MAELNAKAKNAGLWNMFLPKNHFRFAHQSRYASICERSSVPDRAELSTARRRYRHMES